MSHRGRHGHPRRDRLRAMRFVRWADRQPAHVLTVQQIAGLLDISRSAASRWLRDYRAAKAPAHIAGVPDFLTPVATDVSDNALSNQVHMP